MHREQITHVQLEGTTPLIEFDIQDPETGTGFPPTTLNLTLWDAATGAIVNSRDGVDILSSVDAQGHVKFWLTTDDMAILNPLNVSETRRALFVWTWFGGERHDGFEVEFTIANHEQI